jgi:hypothetical protein
MAIFRNILQLLRLRQKPQQRYSRHSERQKMAEKAPWLFRKAKPLVKMYHRFARKLGASTARDLLIILFTPPKAPKTESPSTLKTRFSLERTLKKIHLSLKPFPFPKMGIPNQVAPLPR